MSWRIVEDRTPRRCCARCGTTPAEAKRLDLDCNAYGQHYYEHLWIWWKPAPNDAASTASATTSRTPIDDTAMSK